MKATTDTTLSLENQPEKKITLKTKSSLSKSARPMKSMMKLRSLKPKRIEVGTTLRRKPIKA